MQAMYALPINIITITKIINTFLFRYDTAWGWSDEKKRKELKDENAKFIIAFERETRKPIAFSHFRYLLFSSLSITYFCIDLISRMKLKYYMCKFFFSLSPFSMLFTRHRYELQLEASAQSKGIGKFIMQVGENKKNQSELLMLF